LEEAHHLHREHGTHQDFYFASAVPLASRTLLRQARSNAVRRLLVVLLEEPELTLEEAAGRAAVSLSRASIHLRRLLALGLVESGRRERWRTFHLADRRRVAQLLVQPQAGYADRFIDRLVDSWAELFPT
jgi:DNA-binding MarR family transcriptional regulator